MKILLIAGHGNGDPGACGCGFYEADLTRETVSLIKPLLQRYAEVDIADLSRNWYADICKKGINFDFRKYDYVLEVHFNAGSRDNLGNGKTTGTEVYVTYAETGISVENQIVENISHLGFVNRGVKHRDFSLISHIKKQGTSAALLEVCFIDDLDDMKLYSQKKHKIAEAVSLAIASGFGIGGDRMGVEFKDISDHYAKEHIERLAAYGIINGDGDGNFMPDKPITRADAAIMISNALAVCGK